MKNDSVLPDLNAMKRPNDFKTVMLKHLKEYCDEIELQGDSETFPMEKIRLFLDFIREKEFDMRWDLHFIDNPKPVGYRSNLDRAYLVIKDRLPIELSGIHFTEYDPLNKNNGRIVFDAYTGARGSKAQKDGFILSADLEWGKDFKILRLPDLVDKDVNPFL